MRFLPVWVARFVREPPPSQFLPPELISDARLCASLSELILHMPRRGRVGLLGADALLEEIKAISDPLNMLMLEGDLAAWTESESLDWVCLDTPEITPALHASARLLKPGGYLIARGFVGKRRNDAVAFMLETRWLLAWWAYAPDAHYDVALRKPE